MHRSMQIPLQDPLNNTPETVETASLTVLCLTFFYLGATVFGGMWAATQKLEEILVRRRGWLTTEELQAMLVASTLIPAPKFLALAGLVGFRLRKWPGSVVSVFALIMPGALLVLLGAHFLIGSTLLEGPLSSVRRAVGIGVVGLLFGNAYHQLEGVKVKGHKRIVGVILGILVAITAMLGVPLLLSAALGFIAATIWIREDKDGLAK